MEFYKKKKVMNTPPKFWKKKKKNFDFQFFLIFFFIFSEITFYHKFELDIHVYIFCKKIGVFGRRIKNFCWNDSFFCARIKKKLNVEFLNLRWESIELIDINIIPIAILVSNVLFWLFRILIFFFFFDINKKFYNKKTKNFIFKGVFYNITIYLREVCFRFFDFCRQIKKIMNTPHHRNLEKKN